VFLHPHNLYLAVTHQGGLIGLALLLGLLGHTLLTLMQHYRRGDAKLALGILGLALPACLVDGHELVDKVGSTWFLIWLPVGISVGLRLSATPPSGRRALDGRDPRNAAPSARP
jgi:O-antigen ligase